MVSKEPAELTNEELLLEAKRLKPMKIMDAVLIGVLIGIATYSTVKNGAGLLSFLPLVYLPIAARNRIKLGKVEALLKERGLSCWLLAIGCWPLFG
ncbi:MAG: FUSC family protein [Flavobacteriales bacterium]|nr:FUSC family protein [Flavobacteriales bacterium]